MSFEFENLLIWQKAMVFGEELHIDSKAFPKDEMYNLASQMKRAGDFIALNIAEGSMVQSSAEFNKFMEYTVRTLAEVATCLHKANEENI